MPYVNCLKRFFSTFFKKYLVKRLSDKKFYAKKHNKTT